jgi:hypothetical protein
VSVLQPYGLTSCTPEKRTNTVQRINLKGVLTYSIFVVGMPSCRSSSAGRFEWDSETELAHYVGAKMDSKDPKVSKTMTIEAQRKCDLRHTGSSFHNVVLSR